MTQLPRPCEPDPYERQQLIEMRYCERCPYEMVCTVYGEPHGEDCKWKKDRENSR